MNATLATLIGKLSEPRFNETKVIPWGAPVPSFGDVSASRVATLGINPSNREFVDALGMELDGADRRFQTLRSLGIASWNDVNRGHFELILDSCRAYFNRNPYDGWFRRLDTLLGSTRFSFYRAGRRQACHLDLIPYATQCKWTELSGRERTLLLQHAGNTLGHLLRESPVQMVILNGNSVVKQFQQLSGIELIKQYKSGWTLPRRSAIGVAGFSYHGQVRSVSGVGLGREILVVGYNHNIQSSFGVTNQVIEAIRDWIGQIASEALA